jgi:hypothetical protein
MRRLRRDKVGRRKVETYQCSYCRRRFRWKTLMTHIVTHKRFYRVMEGLGRL